MIDGWGSLSRVARAGCKDGGFYKNIRSNVPTGTFRFAEEFSCKLLILRAGFWTDQWNQGIRLWKKCLLSRGSTAY